MIKIVLNAKDFADLVAGRVATCSGTAGETVQILLSDIGFMAMDDAIVAAERQYWAVRKKDGGVG